MSFSNITTLSENGTNYLIINGIRVATIENNDLIPIGTIGMMAIYNNIEVLAAYYNDVKRGN